MTESIVCAIISGVVTLIVSILTFQASTKKDRDKQREDLKSELIKYHEKNREEIKEIRQNDLREIRDDLTAMGANLQQKIAIIELSLTHTRQDIEALSQRVEKHNGVIERTYRLEDNDKLLEEKIKVANNRIADLERKGE